MGKLELITPGHAPPLDTLIALGLSQSIINVDPDAELSVKKRGNRYRILVETDVESIQIAVSYTHLTLPTTERV